jgi:hypothetical protein
MRPSAHAMKYLLATAAVLALTSVSATGSAHAIDVFEEGVSCSKEVLGCGGTANSEIVAALEKLYPNAETIWAFKSRLKNGKYRYWVTFYTDDGWHMSCRLRFNPVRLGHCGIIHA